MKHPYIRVYFCQGARGHERDNNFISQYARANIRIGIRDCIVHIHIEQTCIRTVIPVAADNAAF